MNEQDSAPGRRDFLKVTGSVAASIAAGFPAIISAQSVTNSIKIGLVGCGGRGTGAAAQALTADDYAELTALADIDQGQIDRCLDTLGKRSTSPAALKLSPSSSSVSMPDKQLIDSGVDVVLLVTPPGSAPCTWQLALRPRSTSSVKSPSPPTLSVSAPSLETTEKFKAANLSLVSGFCWRYSNYIVDTFKQMQDGAIGRPISYYATYYTSPVKPMPPASTRPAGISDTEWQIRNWYNFVWICGDSIVEQAVHSVDKIAWLMGDQPPVSCVGVGGRDIKAEGGNIYDHFEVNYLYPNGFRATLANRQIEGCYNENADYIMGTDGVCTIGRGPTPRIEGKTNWAWSGQKYDMYQREHDVFFASIRQNKPINNGRRMATSTLLAMMGRMAAYTGQEITWDQALNSQLKLVPDQLDWNGALPVQPYSLPGITKFV